MKTRNLALLFALLAQAAAATGCVASLGPGETGDDDDTVGDDDDDDQPPPPPPPTPTPAVYKRGSLKPIYELTPRSEYGRFTENGDTMTDADFISNAGNFVSASQKLDEIAGQIGAESGLPTDLIPRAEDRQRAQQIPFRGNPSDVDFIKINNTTKVYVPLGGDLMTPGNEIAAVNLANNSVIRVKVGVRPQRVAIHPAGLVFVCNQYSNYISVIDPVNDQPFRNADGSAVEIATDYYCTDLLFVPRNANVDDPDEQDLYVANGYRASVLKYGLTVTRDPLSDRVTGVVVSNPTAPSPENQPAAEIGNVGKNPYRLSLSQDKKAIYVANNRGGEVGRIDVTSGGTRRLYVNAPTLKAVQFNDILLIPTTVRDRGLLAADEVQQPLQAIAGPAIVTGLDGQQHVAHPGALFDDTKSYNFQDLRNGVLVADAQLTSQQRPAYFTDDNSSEPNFVQEQKVLEGAIPQDIVRNAAGTRAFLAMSGSDEIQEIEIRSGAFRIADVANADTMQTEERPFALALDEDEGQLMVANWGGETLEIFDIDSGNRLERIDLGYATADYPATNMELGEFLFYNTDWSGTGRMSCATCHLDELLEDGIGYANGATAPTQYHQVTPNWNLATTGSYFWNGSFTNGSYASLAADAQTRSNCELIMFGLIEGPASNPALREGDPNNQYSLGAAIDQQCRPITAGAGVLPDNFDEIAQIIADTKVLRNQIVQDITGFGFGDVIKVTDWYSVSELRLPPNPLKALFDQNALDSATAAKITAGRTVFQGASCGTCHNPNNQDAPFTDGLQHGSGSEWAKDFVDTYFQDPRIVGPIGGIPSQMLEAISPSVNDREINVHLDPIDYFVPFCFDVTSCLFFEDPLQVRGTAAEDERLDLIVKINLGNVERGHMPGNVRGQPQVNTAAIRGAWWMSNYLRHGLAKSLNEALLAPGHPALLKDDQGRQIENGYAMDALGQTDVHGITSNLTPEQVEQLRLYIQTIE